MAIRRFALLVLTSSVLAIEPAWAQCPDGSPPPCRGSTVAAGTPRRIANPPLDARSWIVVPFDNLSRAQDVEWLRGAAVNLLYLDMSRWRDIRVIDDERVADLVREVPEAAQGAQALSLNAGLAIAKRAGAANLVMGDVLKLGERTTVTAKVFDVKTGTRVRSLREEATVADSVMPMFGKLARKILDVAPPQNANVGALGTQSIGAYQAYVEGLAALNRYDLAAAHKLFDEALKRDSAFALAHFKQSIVMGWENSGSPDRKTHAEAANRLAGGLPARERALITGQLQQTNGDWTKACETYEGLVRANANDVEALYGLADCLYHDPTLEAVGSDTTRLRFRADWQRSIRTFDRVLQLDPTYHLAYQHIIDGLTNERHANVCHAPRPGEPCSSYGAFLIRDGDSLLVTPVSLSRDTVKFRLQAERYVQTSSRRRNLELARTFAEAWVQSAPNEPQARRGLARVLFLQGNLDQANAELARVTAPGTMQEQYRQWLEKLEIAYKLGRSAEAVRVYDSARADRVPIGPPGMAFYFGNAIAGYGPALGRLVEFDSVVRTNMAAANASDYQLRYQRYSVRSGLTGVPHDSLVAAEREAFDRNLPRGAAAATRSIAPSLGFALRAPRATWPAIDTTTRDLRLRPAVALSLGDTARLRAAAMALDSLAAALASAGVADTGFSLMASEAYLALRDTVAALRSVRFALDRSMATTPYFPPQGGGLSPVLFTPRTMLLRADLAAATGQRDEARTWYKRFIDIWATASPELQPLVERARRSLAALGTSS